MTKAATAEKHFPFPGEDGKAELAPVEVAPPQSVTPMDLLQVAISKGVDMGQLEKLMDLHERWEARQALKAFNAAKNAFKAEVPTILKNRHVSFQTGKGTTQYDHATVDAVCDALIPALSKHRLSHRWEIEQPNGMVRVTCILTHELGHSEKATLEAAPDESGSKNPIQSISSTTTYLERITFLAVSGTAAKGTDTDGMAPAPGLQDHLDAISCAPNLAALEQVFRTAYTQIKASRNAKALLAVVNRKDERKAALAKDEPA